MIRINKYILTILACLVLVSCGDDLADLNVDTNKSTSAGSGEELFTAATGYYGIALDAYFNENDALLAQYWAGGPGVALIDIERYFIEPGDFNTEWSFSYLQALSDLRYVQENGNEALSSVANIESVHIYQNLVDHFGDIPYFAALSGDPAAGGNLSPAYDDAELIYQDLVSRLDTAIMVLSSTNDEVGSEDLIYGGDLDKWIAFGNSLKLRLLMRQSITGDQAEIGQKVRDLVANGTFIEDSVGIARIPFGGATGSNFNPQYARRESGIGQFYVASKTTVDALEELNDPRLDVLYDEAVNTNTIVGLEQGNVGDIVAPSADDYSFPSSVAYGESNDVILMSHWEVFFLRAEADVRFGTVDDEEAMFNEAVKAHFSYVGLTDSEADTYLTIDVTYDAAASVEAKSNLIGIQKWISMNGLQEGEGWIESRRFDLSGSNIFTNTTNGIFSTPTRSTLAEGVFPSIYLYPQTELSFNAENVPSGRTVTEKVFWDN